MPTEVTAVQNVMRATNNFLFGYLLLHKMKPIPGTVTQSKTRQVTGLRSEPITIMLLNEHSIKLTSNDLLLWPYISASLNPYLVSFFCSRQWSPQASTCTKCKCCRTLSPNWNRYTLLLPQEAERSLQKREQKQCKIQTQQMPTKMQCVQNTVGQLHIWNPADCDRACTMQVQVRPSTSSERRWEHQVLSLTEKLRAIVSFWEMESQFSLWV